MENQMTLELSKKLKDAVLYSEKTGEPCSPEERAENLDAVRLKLVQLGGVFENIKEMDMAERLILIPTFIRVVDTYLEITKKHEELLAAGK